VKLVAVVLVALAGGLSAVSAHAQTGGGELGSGSVRATARDLGTGTYPGSGVPTRAPSTESLFSWNRQASNLVCVVLGAPPPPDVADRVTAIPGPTVVTNEVIGPGEPVDVPAGAVALDRLLVPPDAVVVGDLVYDVGEQPTLLLVFPRCIRPGAPLLGEPPSPAEIWQETPLPRTQVHASPPGSRSWPGITRLATFFWGTAVPETSAQVSLRGFDVAVVAHPIAYAWDFGEGTTLVTADAGSAAVPTRVTFVRRGDYRVRLYVVWEGRARISFRGIALADQDLGTVTLAEGSPYHVAEIRALLRTTPGRR
jgi:hypothetical protein